MYLGRSYGFDRGKNMRDFSFSTIIALVFAFILLNFSVTAFAVDNMSKLEDKAIKPINNSEANFANKDHINSIKIVVRKSSLVNNRKISLGDIADINAPDLIKQRLSAITIGFAPKPGHFRIFEGGYLSSRIKSDNLFLRDFQSVSLIVPDEVYVKRKSQTVSRKLMEKFFINYVKNRVDNKEFKIRQFSMRGRTIYPDGVLSFSLSDSGNNMTRTMIKGRVSVYVVVKINNRDCGRLSLSGWVDVFDNVICASRNLPRGTILSLNDVHTERVNISKFFGSYFTNLAEVKGKLLKIGITQGRCITSDMIEQPALVHRGDIVKMIVKSGALKIVAIGIAKNSGKLNDQIRVENIRSKKIVYGVVKGKSRVNVLF